MKPFDSDEYRPQIRNQQNFEQILKIYSN